MDIAITKANFDTEVLKSEAPVIVDFWAPWCSPCRIQNPILEELAVLYKEKLKIGKVNVDVEQDLAQDYNVMSIPTLKIFHKGSVVSEMIGVQTKERLVSELKKVTP